VVGEKEGGGKKGEFETDMEGLPREPREARSVNLRKQRNRSASLGYAVGRGGGENSGHAGKGKRHVEQV